MNCVFCTDPLIPSHASPAAATTLPLYLPPPLTVFVIPHPPQHLISSHKYLLVSPPSSNLLTLLFSSLTRRLLASRSRTPMRGALFNGSTASRTSPSMPVHSSLCDSQYYNQYQYASAAPRYQQGSFPPAPTGATMLGGAAGDTLTSFGSRQSWSSGSQHGSDYDSPNSTPYSEYGPPLEQEYYSNTSSGQGVGYPESSQRTHVSSDATYSAMYAGRYYSPSSAGALSPRTSRSPEEELASYQFTDSPQHASPVLPSDSTLKGGHGSWQDFPESSASYDRLSSTTSSSYPRPQVAMSSHLHSLSSVPVRSRPAQFTSTQDTLSVFPGRAATRGSPTLPSHSSHLRLHGALGEPGNPSVVPPLVYDGEEYDDESEGSLPSAGSDSYRTTYQQIEGRSSLDDMAGSVATSGGGNSSELRSSTPPHDSDLSSPSMSSGGERTKTATQKKSKMHQCGVCQKWFPRPSGLATHMNSHSGAKREY